jgi:hypothetical protein
MKTNMGSFDGWLRTLFFIVALSYAVLIGSTFSFIFLAIGVVFFATAVIKWCPIYEMGGISTFKK